MNDDDFFKDVSSNNDNTRDSNVSSGNGVVSVNGINHNNIDIIDENKKWLKEFSTTSKCKFFNILNNRLI